MEIQIKFILKLNIAEWGMYKKGDTEEFFINVFDEKNGLVRFPIDKRWDIVSKEIVQGQKPTSENDTKALRLQNVKPCFLPQPSDIETYCDEKEWRHYDDDGWTGQFTISAKNILDIMIDLNKA